MNAILKRIETWSPRRVLYFLVGLAIVSIIISLTAHIFSGNLNILEWLDSAAQNFSTEMMGAIVTFGLFELILGSQKEKCEKADREIKEQQERTQQIDCSDPKKLDTKVEKLVNNVKLLLLVWFRGCQLS